MKQITLLALIALAIISISCSAIKPQKSYTLEYIVDFTEYTKKGFLFTPEKYNEEYESVGLITLELYPEIETNRSKLAMVEKDGTIIYKTTTNDGYRTVEVGAAQTVYIKELILQDAIEKLYVKANEMGANAIMNFNYQFILVPYSTIHYNAIRINGFAIKRR